MWCLSPLACQELRNQDVLWKKGIKKNYWHISIMCASSFQNLMNEIKKEEFNLSCCNLKCVLQSKADNTDDVSFLTWKGGGDWKGRRDLTQQEPESDTVSARWIKTSEYTQLSLKLRGYWCHIYCYFTHGFIKYVYIRIGKHPLRSGSCWQSAAGMHVRISTCFSPVCFS